MALLGQLNSTTRVKWLSTTPQDILNTASPLLWKLMGKAIQRDNWTVKPSETIDGGSMIKVPLKYGQSNRGSYGAETTIDYSKQNLFDSARFRWAGVQAANSLNLADKVQNSGAEAMVDLTSEYIDDIILSARVQMAEDILSYAGDDPYKLNGLLDLFNLSTGSLGATSVEYGSIAESTMANWKANVIETVQAISFEVLQQIFRTPNMGDHAGTIPDFCVTTKTLLDAYERSMQPQQMYTGNDKETLEAGWQNVRHKGATITSDKGIPTGYFFALNTNFLSLRSHKDFNFTMPKWSSLEILGKPDVYVTESRWQGNLFCSNRQMQVCHINLTEPE